jgi:hypothetical protein
MPDREEHRALRLIVWVARSTCCFLIAVAIFNVSEISAVTRLAWAFSLLASVALGVLGIACLVGLELFLRSFYRSFSQN